MSIYGPVKRLLWLFSHVTAHIEVIGHHHIPARGPCLLIGNHQSILDPIFIQTHVQRHVHAMAKSTQFAHPLFRRVMPGILAFPTRRYRIDPQAVRVTLRLLGEGRLVCIYPEGERSWDGTVQPFRRGTVRLILKAGVPVVPCGIQGSYDVWPRWSRRIRRARVVIRFGEPLHFGRHDRKAEREAEVPRVTAVLQKALRTLSGESAESGRS